jgi:hypothetical protein
MVLGGRVRDDPVGGRPARTEQLCEHGRVGIHQALPVGGMGAALLGEKEAGARDRALGAGGERRRHVPALGDAAG